jgi:hypothetical protein
MKKQGFKKLEFSRETLRTLDEKTMREVAGAESRANSCDPYTLIGCTQSKFC